MTKTLMLLTVAVAFNCYAQLPAERKQNELRARWSHDPEAPNWIGYVRYTHNRGQTNSIQNVRSWFLLTTGSLRIQAPCKWEHHDREGAITRKMGERIKAEVNHVILPREEKETIILIPSFMDKTYAQIEPVMKKYNKPVWTLIREQRDGDQFWKAEWLFWDQVDPNWTGVPLNTLPKYRNNARAKNWVIMGVRAKFEKLEYSNKLKCYGAWYMIERSFDTNNKDNNK